MSDLSGPKPNHLIANRDWTRDFKVGDVIVVDGLAPSFWRAADGGLLRGDDAPSGQRYRITRILDGALEVETLSEAP